MAQVKVKTYPLTDTSIVPAVFYSSFLVDPEYSPKDTEDMVSTWVNIEDDREIVDAIVVEELKNHDDVSAMDIDVYNDDFEVEDISSKDKNYTHLEAMEAMDGMRSYMTENAFPLEIFDSLDRLHWAAQNQIFKGKKKEPSIHSFFNRKK